jgi:thiol-disulfide isomerase/thioredoxin
MRIRSSFRWLAGLAITGVVALALASGGAADILKSITDFRMTITREAQDKAKETNKPVDFTNITSLVKAKAEEALKGVEPSKVDPAEALDWAKIFNMAGRQKDTQVVLASFLASAPDPTKAHEARILMLAASYTNKDYKTTAATLEAMKPQEGAAGLVYASLVISYAPRVANQLGTEKAIKLMESALASVNPEGVADAMKPRLEALKGTLLTAKIDVYKEAGQREKALGVLDEALKTAEGTAKARLSTLRNQVTLIGSVAPALTVERGYGNFPGLEALKGKVVVLDFFAHWCGPCKAAFPSMREMYAQLQSKGLEIVGVTRYYGYVGDRTVKLTPDEEYAKMEAFKKEQDMTWPIVFGQNGNFEAYGVTAIPHVAVIGRDGKVHHLDIGYSPELFAKFRKNVEALLAEK